MSTLQAPSHTSVPAGPGPRAPWTGLLLAEWTKIRSVRSTVWSLLSFMVVAIGVCTLIAFVIANQWNKVGPHPEHATILADPTGAIYGAGFDLGQLALAVLGVIVITSEYSSGAIRSSLLAVPNRISMLVAKVVVFGVLVFIISAITVFAVFFIATTIYHPDFVVTLGQPGVLRATIGGIIYLTVLGLFSMAIGGLIRHTAGAVATVIGLILVVPIVVSLIPGTIAAHVNAYLPTNAGHLIAQTSQQSSDLLSPWQGFGVFCLWTAVLLIACGWLLKQRDA
jgi:ABC-2 type transport system permease protein